jgi:hypothetical protein
MGEQISFDSDLIKAIDYSPVRETSGSETQRRFSYQNAQVLRSIIEVHPICENFNVVCEAHDDFLIIRNHGAVEKLDFYQVKTLKKGQWKFTARKIAVEQKEIIAKMVDNLIKIEHSESNSNMITNAQVSNGRKIFVSKEKFAFNELTPGEKTVVLKQIQELKPETAITHINKIAYQISDLPLESFEQTAKGYLEEFLSKTYPNGDFKLDALFRCIMVEIRKRSETPAEAGKIIRNKSIHKSEFNEFIETANKATRQAKWDGLKTFFAPDKIGLKESAKIHKGYTGWLAASTDYSNTDFQEFNKHFGAVGKSLLESGADNYDAIKSGVSVEYSVNFTKSAYDMYHALVSAYFGIYE